jgi:hypothetical protein
MNNAFSLFFLKVIFIHFVFFFYSVQKKSLLNASFYWPNAKKFLSLKLHHFVMLLLASSLYSFSSFFHRSCSSHRLTYLFNINKKKEHVKKKKFLLYINKNISCSDILHISYLYATVLFLIYDPCLFLY